MASCNNNSTDSMPPVVKVYTSPNNVDAATAGASPDNSNNNSDGGKASKGLEEHDEKLLQLKLSSTLLQSQVTIQDRTYKLQHYPSCFIGSEAVDLLLQNGVVESRSEAVSILQTLMTGYWDNGEDCAQGSATGNEILFEHVTEERRGLRFDDDYQFYHFVRQRETCANNSNEGTSGDNNNITSSDEMADNGSSTPTPIMDKYGFLIDDKRSSMDANNSLHQSEDSGGGGGMEDETAIDADKWEELLDKAEKSGGGTNLSSKLQNTVKLYTRKGVPDSVRQRAWTVLTGVDQIMKKSSGQYEMLLKQADFEWKRWNRRASMDGGTSVSEMSGLTDQDDSQLAEYKNKRPVHTTLEQIERDIERTFPNHYLFKTVKEEEEEEEEEEEAGEEEVVEKLKSGGGGNDESESSVSADSGVGGGGGSVADEIKRELNSMVEKMKLTSVDGIPVANIEGGTDNSDRSADTEASADNDAGHSIHSTITPSSSRLSEMGHGQGALRRVLRAYSQYDADVGYCQGMNFIVAMFLTFLSEEESFWLLVIVMNEEQYHLRELFGEDMAGTHEILYISDKLMKQLVPKLWRHLEREGIHNSMFVTQWLLTVYTSSFPFDLVSRVWDSFLVEGWKVVYRVMLSLLKHAEPTLLEMPFEQILMFLRDYPTMINGQTIMQESLQIGLKRKHVQKYVNAWRIANPTEGGPTRVISRRDSDSGWSDTSPSAGAPSKKMKSGASKFSMKKIGFKKRIEKEIVIEDLAPKLLPIVGSIKFAVLIHNALTPAECKQLIDRAEKGGFEDASVYDRRSNRIHRNCKRWFEDDPALAEDWYERILKALDDSALEYKIRNAPWMGTRYNAMPIRSVGINERLRVLKYNQGEYFGSHCDTKFVRGPEYGDKAGQTSYVSVQVYLNEKFKGGQTRFIGAGRHYDVKPKTGSILIFDHNILHQGEVIKAGKKYVVRTDVMYRAMRTRDDMSTISGFPDVIGLGLRQAL